MIETLILGFLWYQIIAHLGISAGLHRYFAHRQFKASPLFEVIVLYMSILAGSRSPIGWIAAHRMHHSHSDNINDPHSPKTKGFWTVLFSMWTIDNIPRGVVKDLFPNTRLKFFHRYWKQIWGLTAVFTLAISPYLFVGFVLIPAIFGRLGFGMVNAITHKNRTVENVPWINILAAGEGYHKEHHYNGKRLRFHRYDLTGFLLEKIVK
jgi:stearoyl-CoA desaturase (delta-9 desaturase)